MIRRMPVACSKDRQFLGMKGGDIAVEHRDHLITLRHGKAATGQKIILHIDHDQCITGSQMNFHDGSVFQMAQDVLASVGANIERTKHKHFTAAILVKKHFQIRLILIFSWHTVRILYRK